MTEQQRGKQPRGKQIRQDEAAVIGEHAGTFSKPLALIGPVIERSCGHDEIEMSIRERKLFRPSQGEPNAAVVREFHGSRHHRFSGVNTDQLFSVVSQAMSKVAQQQSRATSDIEHVVR